MNFLKKTKSVDYDEIYQGGGCRSAYFKHYTESPYYFLWCVIVDRLLRYKIDSILDIGCGPGQFALFLQDKGFRRYLGLDLSEVAVKMAREKCPSFEFIRSDIYESSILEDGAFDIVICLEVLEHLEKDIEILKRIASNTRFIGSVPNYNSAGHLRYFANKAEVETRYQELFDKFSVEDYLLDVKGHKFYLMEGIRI